MNSEISKKLFSVLGSLVVTASVASCQSGGSYGDISLDSDGVTVYGYSVGDFSMIGGGLCNHSYTIGFDFYDQNYNLIGSNDGTSGQTAPASQQIEIRHDDTMITDGTGTTDYQYSTLATAYCACIGRTFYNTGWIPVHVALPVMFEITTVDQGNGACTSAPNCTNTPSCCQTSCVVYEADGGPCDPGHQSTWLATSDNKGGPYTCWVGISTLDPYYQAPHYCQ